MSSRDYYIYISIDRCPKYQMMHQRMLIVHNSTLYSTEKHTAVMCTLHRRIFKNTVLYIYKECKISLAKGKLRIPLHCARKQTTVFQRFTLYVDHLVTRTVWRNQTFISPMEPQLLYLLPIHHVIFKYKKFVLSRKLYIM